MNQNNIFRTINCSLKNKKYINPLSDIQIGLITRAVFNTYELYRNDDNSQSTYIYGGMISVSFIPCLKSYSRKISNAYATFNNAYDNSDNFVSTEHFIVEEIDIKIRIGDEYMVINDVLNDFKNRFRAYKINTILQDENLL